MLGLSNFGSVCEWSTKWEGNEWDKDCCMNVKLIIIKIILKGLVFIELELNYDVLFLNLIIN